MIHMAQRSRNHADRARPRAQQPRLDWDARTFICTLAVSTRCEPGRLALRIAPHCSKVTFVVMLKPETVFFVLVCLTSILRVKRVRVSAVFMRATAFNGVGVGVVLF